MLVSQYLKVIMVTIYNILLQAQVKEFTAMNLNNPYSCAISFHYEPLSTVDKNERDQDNLVQIMQHGQFK